MNNIKTRITVKLEYGELETAMTWCRKNCRSEWWLTEINFDHGSSKTTYEFIFDREEDLMLFELKYL
jgi:hypothetical protein